MIFIGFGALFVVVALLLCGVLALTNERETKKRQSVRRGLHDILKTLEDK
jgi:hypothetical protein